MLTIDQAAVLVRKGHADYASVEKARAKVLADALPALDSSIQSIAKYGDPDSKPAAIAASVAQFVDYVMGHGVDRADAEAAAERVVAKLGHSPAEGRRIADGITPSAKKPAVTRANVNVRTTGRKVPAKPSSEDAETASEPDDTDVEYFQSLRAAPAASRR